MVVPLFRARSRLERALVGLNAQPLQWSRVMDKTVASFPVAHQSVEGESGLIVWLVGALVARKVRKKRV